MAEINWLQVSLGAFGGALLGSVSGFLSNLYFASRKERADSKAAVKKRRAEYHLSRQEHLAKLLGYLAEARAAASGARHSHINKRSNMPEVAARAEASYEPYVQKFDELTTRAMVEAELYGLIPDCVKIDNLALSSYVSAAVNGRLYFALDADGRQFDVQDAFRHVLAIEDDIRALGAYELAMAEYALSSKSDIDPEDVAAMYAPGMPPRASVKHPKVPYIESLRVYFPKKDFDVTKLDTSFLEERMVYEEERKKALGD